MAAKHKKPPEYRWSSWFHDGFQRVCIDLKTMSSIMYPNGFLIKTIDLKTSMGYLEYEKFFLEKTNKPFTPKKERDFD